MNRMRRLNKLTALFLTVLMLMSLTACGSNSAANTSDSDNSVATTNGGGGTVTVANTTTAAAKIGVTVAMNAGNSWEGNGKYYVQYDFEIKNQESVKCESWTLKLSVPDGTNLNNSWNCNINKDSNPWEITGVDYNKTIESNASAQGIGIIFEFSSKTSLDNCVLNIKMSNGTEVAIDKDGNVTDGTIAVASAENSSEAANSGESSNSSDNGSANANASGNTGDTASSGSNESSNSSGSTPQGGSSSASAAASGRLHVSGTQLVDGSGNAVQLRGVSTHGIGWFPEYVNYDAFATLKNDWGANVVRLAMYAKEGNGYTTGGNQEELKQIIDNGVSYATDLGMYVIIDWHVLNYNPMETVDAAVAFFTEMSAKYAGNTNVIYEICNEPVGADWNGSIKPYAETVISAIRANDANAVILVGTNTWSQDVDAVIGNMLSDDNVMYVLHYYAATHKDDLRNKLVNALNNGVPIFVSESSICDASGNGGIDYDSANTWLNLLNSNGISFICWSLCNKAETSALISSGCTKLSGWSDDELTDTGRWYKAAIHG